MSSRRNAFRVRLGLNGQLVAEGGRADRPSFSARAVDLSRTGVGLICAGWPEVGGLVGVSLDDSDAGHRVGRHWSGRVTHAREGSDGVRAGVAFVWPVGPGIRTEAAVSEVPGLPSGWLGGREIAYTGAGSWVVPTVALGGLVADQLSKAWAASAGMPFDGWLDLLPGLLAVAPVENAGALASLADGSPLTAPCCAAVGLALAGLAGSRFRDSQSATAGAALGLLGAGLLGNSVDRLALGHVRDFLVSGLLPRLAFNLADVFLVVGALALAAADRSIKTAPVR